MSPNSYQWHQHDSLGGDTSSSRDHRAGEVSVHCYGSLWAHWWPIHRQQWTVVCRLVLYTNVVGLHSHLTGRSLVPREMSATCRMQSSMEACQT